jgi:hypothetical protein
MWHRVGLVRTDVSEECVASIFRVEKSASEEKRYQLASRQICTRFLLLPVRGPSVACQSQSYITTDSQSASPSWCQAPIWNPLAIFLSP